MKSCPNCQNSYPTDFVVCPQDGTALVEVGAWDDGSVIIGKYRILNKIGQGGMGMVYKAVHVAFDELRAIKVMHPSLMSDESFVKRFRHEARITRRLQHPNAVRVDDIEESDDGRPFIVMEYIEGRSLKSLVHEEGAMQAPRVCSLVKQVAAALDAAHQLGMIHRDIKPENIVLLGLPPHEQAKVLDFGIAKIKEARQSDTTGMTLTGAGVVVGTPQYMSPEQAMGKRGDELDGRSDLYSLGVVMYQMLSGELPFHADTTMEMLIAHMQKPPTPIAIAHPGLNIPEPVANIVMRLLEKNPNLRPPNARALMDELDQAQKAPPQLNVTRVAAPERVYSPEAAARAVRESLEAGMKSTPRHPAPRPVEPPASRQAPPRPAMETPPPQRPEPPVAKPLGSARDFQPQPPPSPPAVRPAPAAQPKSSGWAVWVILGVLIVGVAGGGAWFFLGRQPSSAPPTQTEPVKPSGGQTQEPVKSPDEARQPAQPPGGGTENPAKSETPQAQAPASEQPASAAQRPEKPRPLSAKPAEGQRQARRNEPPPEEVAPAPPVVDEKAVKAALAMGDIFLDRGDYDRAIGEYEKGLRADPSNATLKNKIQAARRAKTAEERLRQ